MLQPVRLRRSLVLLGPPEPVLDPGLHVEGRFKLGLYPIVPGGMFRPFADKLLVIANAHVQG